MTSLDAPNSDFLDEFEIHIGRADKGRTFVRVIHTPSNKKRIMVGIGHSDANTVAEKLAREILAEIKRDE